jgi:hypothetical protein
MLVKNLAVQIWAFCAPMTRPGLPVSNTRTARSPVRLSGEPGPADPAAELLTNASGRGVAFTRPPVVPDLPEQPDAAPAGSAVAMTARPLRSGHWVRRMPGGVYRARRDPCLIWLTYKTNKDWTAHGA